MGGWLNYPALEWRAYSKPRGNTPMHSSAMGFTADGSFLATRRVVLSLSDPGSHPSPVRVVFFAKGSLQIIFFFFYNIHLDNQDEQGPGRLQGMGRFYWLQGRKDHPTPQCYQ
jgi:hypothetical protein